MKALLSLRFISKAALIGMLIAVIIFYFSPKQKHEPDLPLTPIVTLQQIQEPRPADASNIYGPFSYADAVKRAFPAVVNIYTARKIKTQTQIFDDPFLKYFFGNPSESHESIQTGSGSGVIFSNDGYLLTNFHVIQNAQQLRVMLADGRDYPANIVGVDQETDLAVLKIEGQQLTPITLNTSNDQQIGDVVLAIGNPFGVGQTVTMGIISATGRDRLGLNTFENFIQTDAAINPGNSGGALVNAHGELVGINTAIFSKTGGSHGIGFAIPVDIATDVLTQIIRHGKVIRGWLGVDGRDLPSSIRHRYNTSGVFIAGIFRNGPADIAGIKPGDIIIEINGTRIDDTRSILDVVSRQHPGTKLDITALRKGKQYTTTATVIQRPAPAKS